PVGSFTGSWSSVWWMSRQHPSQQGHEPSHIYDALDTFTTNHGEPLTTQFSHRAWRGLAKSSVFIQTASPQRRHAILNSQSELATQLGFRRSPPQQSTNSRISRPHPMAGWM